MHFDITELINYFWIGIALISLFLYFNIFWKKKKLSFFYHISFLFILVGSLYIIYYVFEISIKYYKKNMTLFFIVLLFVLFLNIIILKLYLEISKQKEMKRYQSIYIQQLDLYNKSILNREEIIKKMQREQHDMKQHINIIQELLSKHKYQETEQYLKQILEQFLQNRKEVSKTENLIVDAIVNYKLRIAQMEDINIITELNIPITLEIEAADLAIILGNILDNAIEATKKIIENRYIKLFLRYENGYLFIICINNFNKKLLKDKQGRILSTKEDVKNHGFGLISIQEIAEKYHGSVVIESEENEFRIKVLLFEETK